MNVDSAAAHPCSNLLAAAYEAVLEGAKAQLDPPALQLRAEVRFGAEGGEVITQAFFLCLADRAAEMDPALGRLG